MPKLKQQSLEKRKKRRTLWMREQRQKQSLTQVIRHFSIQLDEWLRQALDSLPECLQRVKFDLARRFSQVLKRQTSLNHLCQAARTVINSAEMTSQMLDDWFSVDLNSIIKQTLYTMESNSDAENMVIVKLARDFEILLEDQAPLESYIEWLDHMVEQCVTKKCHQQPSGTPKIARQFLLMWSCVGTRVIRDMTLHSAPSFGSFHLLHLMFDEYVLYTVENLHNQDKANDLLKAVKGEISLDILDDILLSPPISNKPNIPGCAGSDTIDLHRSSVIRPIDSPFSDTMDSMYYQQDTMRFQQPAMCSEQRGTISSHGQVSNTTTPGNSLYLNQNNCRQKPRDSPPLYSMYQQPDVASHQNNGVNTYNNFDWSRAGHGTTSISGITNEGLQKHFHQPVSVKTSGVMQLQSDIKQNSNNLNPYFPSYTNEQLNFKRQGDECSLFHKKAPNELPDIIPRQNMPDMYYHHVSNMI